MAEWLHPSWQEHEIETVQDTEDQEVERDMNRNQDTTYKDILLVTYSYGLCSFLKQHHQPDNKAFKRSLKGTLKTPAT